MANILGVGPNLFPFSRYRVLSLLCGLRHGFFNLDDELSVMPLDMFVAVAILLLIAGVVGSLMPAMPGALFSLAGIYLYWWSTGFTSPGVLAMAMFSLAGVTALAADYLSGPVAAKMGGASNRTIAMASLVGVVLFFVWGPLGILAGITGTVLVAELHRGRDVAEGVRSAVYAAIGVMGSAVVQFLFTAGMLVVFVLMLVF